ncbi:hypothetical protein D3C80_861780 [compost metagenome]
MQLYAVKAGLHGIAGGLAELTHHGVYVGLAHGAGSDCLHKTGGVAAVVDKHLHPLRLDGRRGDGLGAAYVVRVGDPAHVPELGKHDAPLGVHRLGHPLPASHLLGAVNARGPGIALAQGIYLGALAYDEAGARALGVIGGHHGVGHVTGLAGAGAGHGRHDDAIGEVQLAEAKGAEQGIVVHGEFLVLGWSRL